MGENLQNLKKHKLGELVEFKYGKGLPERDRVPGDYPVYGSGGIVGTHKEALVRGPGIIIGRKGSIGNVFYETNDFFPIDTVFYVNPHSKNIDLYYFSKLLAQIGFQNMNSDAAVPGLKRDLALSQEVLIHDYHDQLKISAILSAYDDLIENNLRRIKILEVMAQLIYREWFVHFRFPFHEKVKMVDSPLGKIPERWEAVKLGDLITVRKGKSITKKTIVAGKVPVVAGGIEPAYYHNVANTLKPVITISASGANSGFIRLYHENVWASDCSFIDMNVSKYVYYFYLQLKNRQSEVTGLQRGSAQPHVYPKDIMELETVKVPGEVLDNFSENISPYFSLICNLLSSNLFLRQTRDLLLPKLISGELDVSDLDITLSEEVPA